MVKPNKWDWMRKKNRKILQIYKTPERIYKLTKEELLKVDGIGEETAEKNNNV